VNSTALRRRNVSNRSVEPAANGPVTERAIDPRSRAANDRPRTELDPVRYLAFVRRIASRMARNLPNHISLDDLVGAGTLGLIDAMDRYDPAKADKFETFAEFRIKGAILDELRRYDLMARNARMASKRITRKVQELTAYFGRPPTEAEIARSLDLTAEEYRKVVDRVGNVRVLSIDDLLGYDDRAADRSFDLAAKTQGPEEVASHRQLHERLQHAIGTLPNRQQKILHMYYQCGMTLKEIGSLVGVTESRICQIMGEATARLRTILKQDGYSGR
jgi:RNA polymerase sigma factor for flagellar operon FliA